MNRIEKLEAINKMENRIDSIFYEKSFNGDSFAEYEKHYKGGRHYDNFLDPLKSKIEKRTGDDFYDLCWKGKIIALTDKELSAYIKYLEDEIFHIEDINNC